MSGLRPSRWVLPLCLLALMAPVSLTGCRWWPSPQPPRANGSTAGVEIPPPPASLTGQQVPVYFSQSEATQTRLKPVVRPLPNAEPIGDAETRAVEAAIRALLAGPDDPESDQGLYSEIPKGTRLLSVREDSGNLYLNFSKQFATGGGSNSMQQRLAEVRQTVVATQRHVAGNQPPKPVFLEVDGQSLKVLGGEGLEVEEPINRPAGPQT